MSEMRKNRKVVWALVLMLIFSVVVSGCAGEGQKTTGALNSLVKNNVNVENVEEQETGFSGSFVQISGLKDKAVEEKVNRVIQDTYMKMKKETVLPPYRGIRQMIKEGAEITDRYIHVDVPWNSNNILCVRFMASSYYGILANGCEEVRAMNFDLNTGEEITLQDVFRDDVDYQEYINAEIENRILSGNAAEEGWYEADDGLRLTGAFGGINQDQKFFLQESTGKLVIILDYENPEVYTDGFYPFYMEFALGDRSALGDRYYNKGKSLYEDESLNYQLIYRSYDAKTAHRRDQQIALASQNDAQLWASAAYYEEMPELVRKYVEGNIDPDAGLLEEFNHKIKKYENEFGADQVVINGSYRLNTNRFGKYVNVSQYFMGGIYSADSGDTYYEKVEECYACFDETTGLLLPLEEMFAGDSEDIYEKYIKKAFFENVDRARKEYGYGEELNCTDQELEEFFDRIYGQMTGCSLSADRICFSYAGGTETARELFGTEVVWQYMEPCSYVKFSDVGCENLTIF